jgi:hypothetical protein
MPSTTSAHAVRGARVRPAHARPQTRLRPVEETSR